jgi:hypothetical protein
MPARDGTGPMGMGPMTGGGRGWCNPYLGNWPPMWGDPRFGLSGWRTPYDYGTRPLSSYGWRFGAFPYPFPGRGRGLRRWWW